MRSPARCPARQPLRCAQLLLCASAALLACAPPADDGAAVVQGRAGIIGGTNTSGDPAVVSLARNVYGSWSHSCTGTLIGPRTILTAAHCTTDYPLYAVFGAATSSPVRVVKIAEQYPHPNYSEQTLRNDIAVLKLENAVADVRPIRINKTALDQSWVTKPLRQVGFGVNSLGGGSGIKREATFAIRGVTTQHLQVGEGPTQICFGDSGGPGFITLPGESEEVVGGVASFTVGQCKETGYDARVDVFATAFVEATSNVWENPTCGADWACLQGCTPIDVDCACASDGMCTSACTAPERDPDCPTDCTVNGVCSPVPCPLPDADCKVEGEACSADGDCLSRTCVSDAQTPLPYCSRTCQATTDCPEFMECRSGTCAYMQRPTAEVGDACSDETYCLFGSICAGPTNEERRCAMPCGTDACDYGSAECLVGNRGELYCAPDAAQPHDAGTTTPVTSQPPSPQPQDTAEEPGPPTGCTHVPGSALWASLAAAWALGRRRR